MFNNNFITQSIQLVGYEPNPVVLLEQEYTLLANDMDSSAKVIKITWESPKVVDRTPRKRGILIFHHLLP